MLSLSLLTLALGVSATTCQNIAGNYYCDETKLVQFQCGSKSGSYNRVTAFNTDGKCSTTPQSLSGALAPFDEELSVHFRGPIQLETFQVYQKTANQQKRRLHHRHAEPEPAVVTAYEYHTAYVTVGGTAEPSVVSSSTESTTHGVFNYNYNHQDESSATGPSVITVTSPTTWAPSTTTSSSTTSTASTSTSSGASTASSSWKQIANYHATSGSASGVAFLNNMGGSGSGVFDFTWGNSLSYAGADGVSCAASPQTLSHTVVPSNKEFIIFSDQKCVGDSCGFYRPGTVAHHGFAGSEKVFLFEFSMPNDGSSGFNADMPAVWFLNAQIPRTLQYGDSSCSCWTSGCGELDLWEVLDSGNPRMLSTLHAKQNGAGGSSNYFSRPTSTSNTFKGAAVFDGSSISIIEIGEIPAQVDDSVIASWISQAGASSKVMI